MIRKRAEYRPNRKNAVSRPSTGLDRAAEAICEPFPNMNGRFSPHKSFSQVKTKITLFFKISYFRPYVYSFCHHFLTKKVNSAPFSSFYPCKNGSAGVLFLKKHERTYTRFRSPLPYYGPIPAFHPPDNRRQLTLRNPARRDDSDRQGNPAGTGDGKRKRRRRTDRIE